MRRSLTLACSGRRGTVTAETGTVFDAESASSISSDSQGAPMATTSHYDGITSGVPPNLLEVATGFPRRADHPFMGGPPQGWSWITLLMGGSPPGGSPFYGGTPAGRRRHRLEKGIP